MDYFDFLVTMAGDGKKIVLGFPTLRREWNLLLLEIHASMNKVRRHAHIMEYYAQTVVVRWCISFRMRCSYLNKLL